MNAEQARALLGDDACRAAAELAAAAPEFTPHQLAELGALLRRTTGASPTGQAQPRTDAA
jgi:hypothetical protein